MKNKLASLALAMALITGSSFAAMACPCNGDNSPCKCAPTCKCQGK